MKFGNVFIHVQTLCLFSLPRDCNTNKLLQITEFFNERSDNHDVKRFLVNQQGTGSMQGAQWSDWGQWSPCTFSGDRYIMERYRKCDNPPPSLFGRDCDGAPVQMDRCQTTGTWSMWSAWSYCSCEKNHTRNRHCKDTSQVGGTVHCDGSATDVEQCVPVASLNCPINGGWSIWSSWISCSVTCGQGVASRLRLCSNPVPTNGGMHCAGSSVDTKACTRNDC